MNEKEAKEIVSQFKDCKIIGFEEVHPNAKAYFIAAGIIEGLEQGRKEGEKLREAARKVVIHYEFVHRGMPVSTGVFLMGKLEEALAAFPEQEKSK